MVQNQIFGRMHLNDFRFRRPGLNRNREYYAGFGARPEKLGLLFGLPWPIPIRVLTLGAYSRLFPLLSGRPLVPAALAPVSLGGLSGAKARRVVASEYP